MKDAAHDVDSAHEDLVKVAVLHELRVVHNGILKARPDLPLEADVHYVQTHAEILHPSIRQEVELQPEQQSWLKINGEDSRGNRIFNF